MSAASRNFRDMFSNLYMGPRQTAASTVIDRITKGPDLFQRHVVPTVRELSYQGRIMLVTVLRMQRASIGGLSRVATF